MGRIRFTRTVENVLPREERREDVGKLAAACLVLMLACGLMSGCSFFERQGQVAAQETQQSRERVAEDTRQLVKQLQQRVDQLEADMKDLEHRVETKQGSK